MIAGRESFRGSASVSCSEGMQVSQPEKEEMRQQQKDEDHDRHDEEDQVERQNGRKNSWWSVFETGRATLRRCGAAIWDDGYWTLSATRATLCHARSRMALWEKEWGKGGGEGEGVGEKMTPSLC